VSGRDAESDILHRLAKQLRSLDLELDLWRLDLAAITADPRFPGWEVPRSEAWGLVATATDTVESGLPALVLQGHVDVVPPGDLTLWSDDPFTPRLQGGRLHGRGTVDMKGAWSPAWLPSAPGEQRESGCADPTPYTWSWARRTAAWAPSAP
jgi:acetylornithine deacetylase